MVSLKETLVRTTSIKLAIPERIVDAVVTHQFASANSAMDAASNKTVELSGFGKFTFSVKKAKMKLEKLYIDERDLQAQLDNPETMRRDQATINSMLTVIRRSIKQLKPIIDAEL